MAITYGSADDLVKVWRPLTVEERGTVDALLPLVSEMFRARVGNLDDLVNHGRVSWDLVAFTAGQVIKRHLMNPTGAKTLSEGAGPFNQSITLDQSISGTDLYVSDNDIRRFMPSFGESSNIGSIRLRPGLA